MHHLYATHRCKDLCEPLEYHTLSAPWLSDDGYVHTTDSIHLERSAQVLAEFWHILFVEAQGSEHAGCAQRVRGAIQNYTSHCKTGKTA